MWGGHQTKQLKLPKKHATAVFLIVCVWQAERREAGVKHGGRLTQVDEVGGVQEVTDDDVWRVMNQPRGLVLRRVPDWVRLVSSRWDKHHLAAYVAPKLTPDGAFTGVQVTPAGKKKNPERGSPQ